MLYGDDTAGLLLQWGADINAQGGAFGNALQAAAIRDKKELMSTLLGQGAEVNTSSGILEVLCMLRRIEGTTISLQCSLTIVVRM